MKQTPTSDLLDVVGGLKQACFEGEGFQPQPRPNHKEPENTQNVAPAPQEIDQGVDKPTLFDQGVYFFGYDQES